MYVSYCTTVKTNTCSNLRISFVHMVCITFVWACGRGNQSHDTQATLSRLLVRPFLVVMHYLNSDES